MSTEPPHPRQKLVASHVFGAVFHRRCSAYCDVFYRRAADGANGVVECLVCLAYYVGGIVGRRSGAYGANTSADDAPDWDIVTAGECVADLESYSVVGMGVLLVAKGNRFGGL